MNAILRSLDPLQLPRVLGYVGFVVMALLVTYAINEGNLPGEASRMLDMPWGIVALVDLYIGLVLVSCWVLWREAVPLTGMLWTVLILTLGNLVTCLYLVKAAAESDGRISRFWCGKDMEGSHPRD